jgi:hypothetical protein
MPHDPFGGTAEDLSRSRDPPVGAHDDEVWSPLLNRLQNRFGRLAPDDQFFDFRLRSCAIAGEPELCRDLGRFD